MSLTERGIVCWNLLWNHCLYLFVHVCSNCLIGIFPIFPVFFCQVLTVRWVDWALWAYYSSFSLRFFLRLSILMSSSARYILHMTCAKQYWRMTTSCLPPASETAATVPPCHAYYLDISTRRLEAPLTSSVRAPEPPASLRRLRATACSSAQFPLSPSRPS